MNSFSPETLRILSLLYEEERECRKPRKQSSEQKQAGEANVRKQREEGKGFDQMSDSEHKKLSKRGGESERKKKPLCEGEG